jgi:outer membrane protein TolC
VGTRSSKQLMIPRALAALVAGSAIAGCVVGLVYKAPVVSPVGHFRYQWGPSEATSIADLPWWIIFNDTAFQSLIAGALTNAYDREVAVSRIDQARALVGVAKADFYPQIGYQGIAGREKAFVPLEIVPDRKCFGATTRRSASRGGRPIQGARRLVEPQGWRVGATSLRMRE